MVKENGDDCLMLISIHCSPTISLSSVLHVPNLFVNLLSASSLTLTESLNCSVIFFPTQLCFLGTGYGEGDWQW